MTTPPPSPNLDGLYADELRQMVIGLLGAVAKLEAKVAAQAEEIARLKDLKPLQRFRSIRQGSSWPRLAARRPRC